MNSKKDKRTSEDCSYQHGSSKIQNEVRDDDPNINNNIESKSNVLSNGQGGKTNKFSQDLACSKGRVSGSNNANVPNISEAKTSKDKEMRNNVDYGSGVDKCPSKVACSSESSPDAEEPCCSGTLTFTTTLNNIGSSIGSTSHGTCGFLRPNINSGAAGPSTLFKVWMGKLCFQS